MGSSYDLVRVFDLDLSLAVTGKPGVDQKYDKKIRLIRAVLGCVVVLAVVVLCFSLIGMVITEGSFFEWALTGALVALIAAARLGTRYAPKPGNKWVEEAIGRSGRSSF